VFDVVGGLFNKNSEASPVAYAAPGRYNTIGALSGRSDNETYMRAFGTAGTVFQIVSLLAGSCAAPEWRLYRKPKADGRVRYTTGDRGSDQRTEVLQHQALSVWQRPNPFNTGVQFREAGWQHMELTGERWWVVARDPRATFPIGLWLVRPDRMEPVPSADNYIAGYVYTGPSGERVPLQPDEVILTKYPNPLDPYRGLGPVQSVLVDLDAMKYGSEWNRNFFINGAQPGGVVTVPTNLTDEEFDQFSNRWCESHQGVSRAHRVAILEGGATWVPTQQSIKDMDFSNLRNVSRDVIREAWGIHKSMLGNSDEVNRANATTAEEVFGRWKVITRLDRDRDVLNNFYLPMFGSTGEGVEFDYVNPLPDDREADNAELTAKTAAYAVLVNAGVNPDDAAEVVGLPSMRHVQVPAAAPTSGPTSGELEQAGDSDGEPAEDDNPFENRVRELIAVHAMANAAAADHDPAAVDLSEMDAQHQQAVDQLSAQYQQQITPDQQQQALDQIRQAVEAGTIGALGSIVIDYAAAKALILAAMVAFGQTAAKQAAKEAKKQGVTIQPIAPASTQLDGIAESTASLMASELATSAGREATRAAGGTTTPNADAVVAHVEKFLQGLSTAGPATHLGGALAAAANQARHGTFIAGPRCELIASEVRDPSTCPSCFEIDGHSFGYSDDPAAVAEASAAYPTSGYINCDGGERCRGALIARYEAQAEPSNRDGDDLTAMLKRIVDLLEPAPAHINGHDHHEKARA
jgi:HK97 family phage portal protein